MKFKVGDSVKLVGREDETIRTVVGYTDMGVRYRNEGRGYHITCAENELELRQPKFKVGDRVKPKAEFANVYVIKSGWEILEIDSDMVKYRCLSNDRYVTDRCPIWHLELEPKQTMSGLKVDAVWIDGQWIDGQRIEWQGSEVPDLVFDDGQIDFKTVYRSDGSYDVQSSLYLAASDLERFRVSLAGEQPSTWTFKGDLDFVKLRDDMIEAEADWAIVDDVVYIRGRLKHAMDVLGITGATKACRGLWESAIYHEVARTGRMDEILKEVANRPTHQVEVFRCQ